MIALKILLMMGCAELWYQGGQSGRAWMRDVLITILMGAWIGYVTVWWIGIISVGSFNIIRIGYGVPDESDEGSLLGRIFKKPWLVRGVAGGLYGLVGLLPFVVYTQQYHIYLCYASLNFAINSIGEALAIHHEVWDRVRGLVIGSIVFLI